MIQLPERSVTRFFIPLIDVLVLLFCIYLLMPIVRPAERTGAAEDLAGTLAREERGELERLRREARAGRSGTGLEAERQELERIRREKMTTLQRRLAIRVLEIDPDSGKLYYYEGPDRVEVADEAAARALIERQRREVSGRELYYLFLFPRRVTGYPEERQVRQYERWFEGVAHGFDNPRGGP